MRTLHERENLSGLGGTGPAHYAQNSLPRAKSDFNLALVGTGQSSGGHISFGTFDVHLIHKYPFH